MKLWSMTIVLVLLASLAPGAASAQDYDLDRYAFGIGIGLVDLSDVRIDDNTETYVHANFRILIGAKAGRDDKSVVAYLEPEIGYWERNLRVPLAAGTVSVSESDLMIGLNIIGLVPFERVDYFFGAGLAIHSFDAGLDTSGVQIEDDEVFGVNVQTGIDVRLSESIGVFGLLRLDLVEDIKEEQAKITLGIRFFFG